ncbi:MAG: ferritin family protein [Proteobacteria bacterium]|nr:ferritin family protein [Pseudomonadota bacterium]
MSYDFSADEIFALAEEIEKNGARFYRNAAAKVACGNSKKLLSSLAEMEEAHLNSFTGMRKELPETMKQSTVFDPAGENALYLKSLADARVFTPATDPAQAAQDACSDDALLEILEFALGREKDSIVFYLGIKDMVATEEGKCRVDEIIREEMNHIRLLTDQMQAVKKRLS